MDRRRNGDGRGGKAYHLLLSLHHFQAKAAAAIQAMINKIKKIIKRIKKSLLCLSQWGGFSTGTSTVLFTVDVKTEETVVVYPGG